MLPTILRFLFTPWRWAAAFALSLWRALPALRLQRHRPLTTTPADATPLTDEQRAAIKAEYIQSVDRDAVCALASRHNDGLPCRPDESAPVANGSFNVCFFVEFHTTAARTQWVVRLPIEPLVHRTWEKVQSEVCTMRYVRARTTIPVPQVHAYGRARLRHGESAEPSCYMILERAEGQPLTGPKLLGSSTDRRRQFFTDLIAILAQLRGLGFKAAGSLMPGRVGTLPMPGWLRASISLEPTVDRAISMSTNELELVQGGCAVSLQAPPTSTSAFVALEHSLLWDVYLLPRQDMEEAEAQYEVFALHTVRQHQLLRQEYENRSRPERFVLTHTDLRGANIMVDDQLRIQAIIDWEWAVTVPAAFFTPPFWIMDSQAMFAEFRHALASVPPSLGPSAALLQKQWASSDGNDLKLHIAQVFLDAYSLVDVFYKSIYPRLFDIPDKEALRRFFLDQQWQEEIRRRLRSSDRFAQYLKANNLYTVDEETQRLKDWIAQGRALLSTKK